MTAADTLLLKVPDDGRDDAALVADVRALAGRLGHAREDVSIMRGLADPVIYVYIDVPATSAAADEEVRRHESAIAASGLLPAAGVSVARLARYREFAGASAGGAGGSADSRPRRRVTHGTVAPGISAPTTTMKKTTSKIRSLSGNEVCNPTPPSSRNL